MVMPGGNRLTVHHAAGVLDFCRAKYLTPKHLVAWAAGNAPLHVKQHEQGSRKKKI